MVEIPEEIDVPTPSETSLSNVRFLPLTLETVDIYVDNTLYMSNNTLSTANGYRIFSSPRYLPNIQYSTVSFTSRGYDFSTINAPFDENEIYTITLHPAVAIPNITINGSDYWETHKSEYNALIGNPVGTFKIDLSSYNTTANTLYAWTTENTSTATGAELPITFYTKTSTPTENSTIYNANGTDITSSFVHGAAYFSEVTTNKMTWTTSEPV